MTVKIAELLPLCEFAGQRAAHHHWVCKGGYTARDGRHVCTCPCHRAHKPYGNEWNPVTGAWEPEIKGAENAAGFTWNDATKTWGRTDAN